MPRAASALRLAQIPSSDVAPRSVACVVLPITLPFKRPAPFDHRTAHIAAFGRPAPSGGSIAARAAGRQASHGRAAHQRMSVPAGSDGSTYKIDERGFGGVGGYSRTWLVRSAASIGFAGGNARQSNAWSFLAPDRTIAVPHRDRFACESLTRWDDDSGREEQERHMTSLSHDYRGSSACFAERFTNDARLNLVALA